MADKREQILVRIFEVLQANAAALEVLNVYRNRQAVPNNERPAIVLMDGDDRNAAAPGNSETDIYRGVRPQIVTLVPEIYIVLDESRPIAETRDGVNPGTALNTKRLTLSRAICTDETLLDLLGSNGGIKYNGSVTDMKSGGALQGQLRLDFQFLFIFDPLAT